MLLIM